MVLKLVNLREKITDVFNVIIQISFRSDPIKYEVDKEKGTLLVDRFMSTSNVLANIVMFHRHCMRMATRLIS